MSPRGSQPTLGFCFSATAKQVLRGYKKALEAGQAGSRAAGIHARALAGCHRLTCQGKQCYLPRNRGTENTTTAAPTPNTRSRGRARQPPAPLRTWGLSHARPGRAASVDRGTASPSAPRARAPRSERCWAGSGDSVVSRRGRTFRGCHSAFPSSRASSATLLMLRQRGGRRAGTSARGGAVFWENKSPAVARCGPGDARGWKGSLLTGLLSLGTASVGALAALRDTLSPGTPTPPSSPAGSGLTPWLLRFAQRQWHWLGTGQGVPTGSLG